MGKEAAIGNFGSQPGNWQQQRQPTGAAEEGTQQAPSTSYCRLPAHFNRNHVAARFRFLFFGKTQALRSDRIISDRRIASDGAEKRLIRQVRAGRKYGKVAGSPNPEKMGAVDSLFLGGGGCVDGLLLS